MLVFCASIAEYRCTGGCWIETHEVLKDLWSRMSFTADTFAWLCTVRPGTSHRSQVFCACAATTCAMAKAAHCLKGPVRCSTWTDSHKDQISRPSNSQKYTQNQKEESEWIVKHEKKAREQYGNKANKSFTFFQRRKLHQLAISIYILLLFEFCATLPKGLCFEVLQQFLRLDSAGLSQSIALLALRLHSCAASFFLQLANRRLEVCCETGLLLKC